MSNRVFGKRTALTPQEQAAKYAMPKYTTRPGNIHLFNPAVRDKVALIKPEVFRQPGKRVIFRPWPELTIDEPPQLFKQSIQTNNPKHPMLDGIAFSSPVMICDYVGIMPDKSLKDKFPKNVRLGQTSFVYAKRQYDKTYGYETHELPYPVLIKTCNKGKKGKLLSAGGVRWEPAWNRLYTAMPNRKIYASLSDYPRQAYFIVGSLYENGDTFDLRRQKVSKWNSETKSVEDSYVERNLVPYGMHPNDPLVVLKVTGSTGRQCLDLIEHGENFFESETYKNFKDDKDTPLPDPTFPYGDALGKYDEKTQSLRGGLFMHVYDSEVSSFDMPNSLKAITSSDYKSYTVGLTKTIPAYPGAAESESIRASIDKAGLDHILNRQLYMWSASESKEDRMLNDYLLHIPEIEEQCELLAHAFYPAGNLIKFAWAETPEFLRFESVSALLNNRKQFVLAQYPEDCTDPMLIGNLFSAVVDEENEPPRRTANRQAAVVDDYDTDAIMASVNTPQQTVKPAAASASFTVDDDDDDDELVSSQTVAPATSKIESASTATKPAILPSFDDDNEELAGADFDTFEVPDLNTTLEKARKVNRRFNK